MKIIVQAQHIQLTAVLAFFVFLAGFTCSKQVPQPDAPTQTESAPAETVPQEAMTAEPAPEVTPGPPPAAVSKPLTPPAEGAP